MSNHDDDEETVSITDVSGDTVDYHAMMNAEPGESRSEIDSGVTTIDGGEVMLSASRTFHRDPAAPRWQISIVAEEVDDPENPPDVAGHVCSCGHGPHEKFTETCYDSITVDVDSAVRLAQEIVRLAKPLTSTNEGT